MEDTVEELTTDVLIAGGGVAGLRAAITATEGGCSVLLVQRGAAASPFLHAFNVAFAGGPAFCPSPPPEGGGAPARGGEGPPPGGGGAGAARGGARGGAAPRTGSTRRYPSAC